MVELRIFFAAIAVFVSLLTRQVYCLQSEPAVAASGDRYYAVIKAWSADEPTVSIVQNSIMSDGVQRVVIVGEASKSEIESVLGSSKSGENLVDKIEVIQVDNLNNFDLFVVDYLPAFYNPKDVEIGRFFINGKFAGRGNEGISTILELMKDKEKLPIVLIRDGVYTKTKDVNLRKPAGGSHTNAIERFAVDNGGFWVLLSTTDCKQQSDSRQPQRDK